MPSMSPMPSATAMPASPHAGSAGSRHPAAMKRHGSQSSNQGKVSTVSPGSVGEHHHHHHHHNQQHHLPSATTGGAAAAASAAAAAAGRHPVKPTKHAKIVLPRNHSSGRNLAKLARQAPQGNHMDDGGVGGGGGSGRRHTRQRSHEGDTEIRLPGSLDESNNNKSVVLQSPPAAPAIRRNMTAYQLPRNTSHSKLKKNLSHGQLARVGSGRNLMQGHHAKAPPSPGLRGKSGAGKRVKSVDLSEVAAVVGDAGGARGGRNNQSGKRKIGFAVGSTGSVDSEEEEGEEEEDSEDDEDDDDEVPNMEGSGLNEDDWTDQSASASPATTRQNTANNSRRPSVSFDQRPGVGSSAGAGTGQERRGGLHLVTNASDTVDGRVSVTNPPEADGTPAGSLESEDDTEGERVYQGEEGDKKGSDENKAKSKAEKGVGQEKVADENQPAETKNDSDSGLGLDRPVDGSRRSSTYSIREHSNPAARRVLARENQLAAPALVSNVTTLDDGHSAKNSPAPSMQSSRSNIGDGTGDDEQDELVSRFIGSSSKPTTLSSANASRHTPKAGSFHAGANGSLASHASHHSHDNHSRSRSGLGFYHGRPTSPGSTVSGSSGAATPALGISRTELRLKNEKFMADMEDAAAQNPTFPAYKFDRRNESLKSYLHLATLGHETNSAAAGYTNSGLSLGPEIFQGRFKAVNTELKLVQKFHDPVAASIVRLQKCRDSVPGQRGQRQTAAAARMSINRSATAAAATGGPKGTVNSAGTSTSASPPANAHAHARANANPGMAQGSSAASEPGSKGGLASSKSSTQIPATVRAASASRVAVTQTPSERHEDGEGAAAGAPAAWDPDAIAKRLWESVSA